jgi:hypothetical protein
MAQDQHHATLGVISLGLAMGITWGLAAFLLAVISGLFNWGTNIVIILQSLYVGYGPTLIGAITGAVWGFVDGLIGGVMIAWLYNRLLLVRKKNIPAVERQS